VARPPKLRPVTCTIYQGSDGRWHGWVPVGTRPDGSPDRRQRTGKTKTECEARVRDLEDSVAAGKTPALGRSQTVAEWLTHWCEHIAKPHVSHSTYKSSYAYSVYRWLIPGVGRYRLDALTPEHLETLYEQALARVSPGTVALIHRTVRAALNEAVLRGRLRSNPALVARSYQSEADEVVPLTQDEARRVLAVVATRRTRARWSLAMLGLRQGEVLGLRWDDVDLDAGIITIRGQAQRRAWQHGCDDPAECARWRHGCPDKTACTPLAVDCPRRQVRCRVESCRPAWAHGCDDPKACSGGQGRTCPRRRPAHCPLHQRDTCPPPCPSGCTGHASCCPQRTGGGIVLDEGQNRAGRRQAGRRRLRVKTVAGGRRVALPAPIVGELAEWRAAQLAERQVAGTMWVGLGLVFTTVTGAATDSRRDWGEWKQILAEAGVRDVRLHDARHTASTMLLLQGVDRRVVMDIMGWSSATMLARYQHVADEMRQEAAKRLGEIYFGDSATGRQPAA
jgi:integrase